LETLTPESAVTAGDLVASAVAFGLAVAVVAVVVVVVLVVLLAAPVLFVLVALLQPPSSAQADRKMRTFANFIQKTPFENLAAL
jgi:hypothetical protein